jgi:hypothetical protein
VGNSTTSSMDMSSVLHNYSYYILLYHFVTIFCCIILLHKNGKNRICTTWTTRWYQYMVLQSNHFKHQQQQQQQQHNSTNWFLENSDLSSACKRSDNVINLITKDVVWLVVTYGYYGAVLFSNWVGRLKISVCSGHNFSFDGLCLLWLYYLSSFNRLYI